MAQPTKSTSRSIVIDTQAAELAMERLQLSAAKLDAKIKQGQAAGKAMKDELLKLEQVNSK